jgi:hypothetical protein
MLEDGALQLLSAPSSSIAERLEKVKQSKISKYSKPNT